MTDLRANPPKSIQGSLVVEVRDYQEQVTHDLKTGTTLPIELPKSNVLQFLTEDGTIVSARPSGTEPKIKFYFGVRGDLCCVEKYDEVDRQLTEKIEAIKRELGLI